MKKFYTFLMVSAALTAFTSRADEPDYTTIDAMCASYRWETTSADGDDLKFNVTIKKGTEANSVVINGVFDKYELKGTFGDDGSISIPNQHVGFDPDKGQYISFVHLTYDGDVDAADFVLDNSMDGDLYCYEEFGVVGESMDNEYLLKDGLINYGQFAFLFRTGVLEVTEWEDAGTATLFDGGFFTPLPRFGIGFKTPVEVKLEKSTERPNVYRLVNPWNSYFKKELNSHLEFDMTDPACVIIPKQTTDYTDSELGLASVQNFVGMYISGGFGKDDAYAAMGDKQDQYLCTYDDAKKVITMPVGSTFTTFAGDAEGYWNVGKAYGATDSYIVLPGGTGGIDNVTVDNDSPAVYYNLQGIRIENPARGQLVIRRQGTKVTKILVK